ncbi:MAG: hypothetical protein KGH93_02905 [Patescibacteria group bacterium]|nr:hypothetical protein [Patescibacteria group bacterium]MDE1946120.1 hypothetical protein [Patescibacteria group bacterium]
MTDVIPAIIPESFDDLAEKMSMVRWLVPVVQVDVCDGKFVLSKCWPYKNDDGEFEKILHEDDGFPFWQDLDFEADLMVAHPESGAAENFIKAGAKRIILHIESSDKMLDFVKKLRKEYGYPGEAAVTVEIGIGLNADTDIFVLKEYFAKDAEGRTLADFVQCMGIDRIGYQHQAFDPRVIGKVRDIRKKYPDVPIAVDGGVSLENAHDLALAGATRLVSGSAIYGSDDIKEAIEEMENS